MSADLNREELLRLAKALEEKIKEAGTFIAELHENGARVNVRVYHNGGCESIDLFNLNGELDVEVGLTLGTTRIHERDEG